MTIKFTNKEKLQLYFAEMQESLKTLKTYIEYQNKFLDTELASQKEDLETKIKEIEKRHKENPEKPLNIDSFIRLQNIEIEIQENGRKIQELQDEGYSFNDEILKKFLLKNSNLIREKEKLEGNFEFDEKEEAINNHYSNEITIYFESTFPSIQNNSTLILLYSHFENSLKKLCLFLGNEFTTPIKYYDLQGDDMIKCENFLIKLCRIREDIFTQSLWQEIDVIRRLRNSAVHRHNSIKNIITERLSEAPIIIKNFEKIKGFEVLSDQNDIKFFILQSDFLEYFLRHIESFYGVIEQEIYSIYKISQN